MFFYCQTIFVFIIHAAKFTPRFCNLILSSSDKSSSGTDEDISSFQASYTMGNMKVKAHNTKADNEGYSEGAEDEQKAIDVSWSF